MHLDLADSCNLDQNLIRALITSMRHLIARHSLKVELDGLCDLRMKLLISLAPLNCVTYTVKSLSLIIYGLGYCSTLYV